MTQRDVQKNVSYKPHMTLIGQTESWPDMTGDGVLGKNIILKRVLIVQAPFFYHDQDTSITIGYLCGMGSSSVGLQNMTSDVWNKSMM